MGEALSVGDVMIQSDLAEDPGYMKWIQAALTASPLLGNWITQSLVPSAAALSLFNTFSLLS